MNRVHARQRNPIAGLQAKNFFILAIIIGVLVAVSRYNFLLFHTFAELLGVGVALGIFFIAWNARDIIDNHYFLFVGVSHFFIAVISLFHTLSYKGMNIFIGYDANLPTQFWILGGYFQCLTFLVAPLFLRRKLFGGILFSVGILLTLISFCLIFYGWFPDCFLEGTGLTSFKKISEILIASGLLLSISPIQKCRDALDKPLVRLLGTALIFNALSRVAFIFYVDVYGLSNLFGHCLYLVYTYYIYLLIIQEGLTRPQNILFERLKHRKDELAQARKSLEKTVAERTSELQKANTRLFLSNRSLEDFAYIVSHDLREPLRGINNYADLILDENAEKLDEEGRYMLKTIIKLARRQDEMINSILEYSRVRKKKFKPIEVNIKELIKNIQEALQIKAANENEDVEIVVSQGIPAVYSDKSLLHVIFSNLISNAIKFNDKDKKVVTISTLDSGDTDFVTFCVKDNGIGIPEKHFEKIFTFFKRLHAKDAYGGGTGIGLAVVKNIIDSLDGKIWVESTPGEGTAFYLKLRSPTPSLKAEEL